MEIHEFQNCSKELPFPTGEVKDIPEIALVKFDVQYFLCIVLLTVFVTYRRKSRRSTWIDSLPGPSTYPLIGGLHHFSDLKQSFKKLQEWSAKYGRIYKSEGIFNETYIFLNDPSYIQAVLSSKSLAHVSKPPIPYDSVFGQFLKNGLLVSKGEYWKSHRRTVARAFTYKSFQSYIKIVNEYGHKIVNDLDRLFPRESSSTEFHAISSLIHCCSLQIICAAVMGLDASDSEECAIFYERFQRYKIISSEKAMNPLFLIEFFWRLHPMSREYDEIIDLLNGITRKIIEKRNEASINQQKNNKDNSNKAGRTSMVDEMLDSGMTPEEVLIEVNTVVAAGFESTSLTIHYLLMLLALNPEHQKICQEEIDEMFNDPVQCHNGCLTNDAISNLKYVEKCCLETLRIFPVIFVFQRRLEEPIKLDQDLEVPAGTNVIIPTYSIHHNPKNFPNPEKFDPKNFDSERIEQRHPYAYLPFSAGIRNCVGMKFAMLEIKAVAAHILRNFHISTADNINDVPILPSIVMTPERDYRFHLKRRDL